MTSIHPYSSHAAHRHPGIWPRCCLLLLILAAAPLLAGDSIYGKIVEVKGADLVLLDYGEGQYLVRIAGIEPPKEPESAKRSSDYIRELVLDKNVRLRFEGRNERGEMVGQLQTDDPAKGVEDVGLLMLKAGIVRRKAGYDTKYQEFSKAEQEAQKGKRGVWANKPAGQ